MAGSIFVGAFLLLVALAGALGWTADSRERGDWSPSEEGRRVARC